MRHRLSLSALVIGSMAPDFAYFLPGASGGLSHSLWGLMIFCLPLGLITYVIFHLLIKRPMVTLFPEPMSLRLSSMAHGAITLPNVSFWTVCLSIILGAFTHVVWDAFTHANTVMVRQFDILRTVVATFGTYKLYLFKLLQHASTTIGLFLLGRWIFRWARAEYTPVEHSKSNSLPLSIRCLVIGGMLVLSAGGGILAGLYKPSISMEGSLFHAAVAAIISATLSVVTFSLAWHAYFLCRERLVIKRLLTKR